MVSNGFIAVEQVLHAGAHTNPDSYLRYFHDNILEVMADAYHTPHINKLTLASHVETTLNPTTCESLKLLNPESTTLHPLICLKGRYGVDTGSLLTSRLLRRGLYHSKL